MKHLFLLQTTLFSYYSNTIEPIAPAQPKLVKRASVPPPTIMTYFTSIKKKAAAHTEGQGNKTPVLADGEQCKTKLEAELIVDKDKPEAKSEVLRGQKVDQSFDDDTDDDIICVFDKTPTRAKTKGTGKRRGPPRACSAKKARK